MVDVQSSPDDRNIAIDQVGVTDLRYPIVILDRDHEKQQTIANLTMSVNLPHHFKGTHMSRFIEVLERHRGEVTMRTLPAILSELKTVLDAESARVEVTFPYFLDRTAPKSGATALMDYECWFVGESNGSSEDFVLGVRVPVTSLCPCSKALADGQGAHNQRGFISIEVRGVRNGGERPALIWIEELIDVAEKSASCPVYPLLKREDEKYVTITAYQNPVFVEDMVRNVAVALRSDARVTWFKVDAANMESIHNHAAFARMTWERPKTS
jgi:GTP cyclohydrolase IB